MHTKSKNYYYGYLKYDSVNIHTVPLLKISLYLNTFSASKNIILAKKEISNQRFLLKILYS